jgi:uncharacterized membrane protein
MTAWLRWTTPAFAAAIFVAMPRLAAACAVCLGGSGGGTQRAFAIGSLLLSVIPLAVIGGAVLYLRRRARAIESEANARRSAPPSRLVSRASSSQ